MKRKQLERAARTALDLAAELADWLPECCAVPAEDLVPVVWGLALRLTRVEVRAAKDKGHAKRYRRAVRQARREVETLLASQDGSAAAAGGAAALGAHGRSELACRLGGRLPAVGAVSRLDE